MIDLHYWPTPNGKKVTILLEECGLPYKIVPVNIGRGDQFTAEFLKMNPNHRMPVMVDHEPDGRRRADRVFESGAIMMYIAEKAGKFWPQDLRGQVRGHPVGDLADGQPGPEDAASAAISAALGQTSRATRPMRSRRFTDEANRLYGVLNNRLYEQPLSGRRRVHDRRHDLLSVDGELEGAGPGHRGVQVLQALVRGARRAAGGAARHGGRRRSLGRPRQAAAPRSRPASARCSTTSAPGRCRRKGRRRKGLLPLPSSRPERSHCTTRLRSG